jgi:D-glycero-D-manno-heptose 1,7-bisphosphate phosphatase
MVERREGSAACGWISPRYRSGSRSAVFLDRDGVINEHFIKGYVLDWSQFCWRTDSGAALALLARTGLPLVVASNQSAVGRGLTTIDLQASMMRRMQTELAARGILLAAWYFCPHAPWDGCDCRKPRPGMLHRASRDLGIDLRSSFMIGDGVTDAAAGEAVGCRCTTLDVDDPASFVKAARCIAATIATAAP